MSNGGTKMYCPECKSEEVCSAFQLREIGEDNEQRVEMSDHSDIRYFRRGRECRNCKNTFQTAEIPEDTLFKLAELRNVLIEIKQDAEAFEMSGSALDHLADISKFIQSIEKINYNWES